MRKPSSTDTQRGLLALLVLALLASALTGCGIGPATKQENISETATTYLRALATADTAKACAQLTRGAKGEACEAAMRKRLPALDLHALKNAADGTMDIEVDGHTATAGLSEPQGARFLLVKVGSDWRIDSGYTLH
jgi:uncharacterized protein YdbL (DUF1318 family)